MSDESIGGRLFREGMSYWRDLAPLAEPYARSMGQLAEMFGFTPASVVQEIVTAARSRLVDRDVELDVGTGTASLVLRDVSLDATAVGPAIGQLGDLTIVADEVHWNGVTVERLDARLRNVHVQPAATPVVVAAPIEFELAVGADEVRRLLATTPIGARVELELGDGIAHVRPLRRRGLGRADVSLEPGPRHVGLHVEQVHAADRWRIGTGVGSLTPLRYPLPEVLHNRVHSIHIEPDRVLLRGHVAEWREPVGVDQLERLVDRLRRFSNGVLRVPRHDDDGVLGGAVDRARAAESAP